MPSKAGTGELDGRRLANLIALFDSPVDAEAAGALHSIRQLKKKHGDVPFYEVIERDDYKAAIWDKFGEPKCLRDHIERQRGTGREAELRDEILTLTTTVTELAEALTEQKRISSELRKRISTSHSSWARNVGGVDRRLFAILALMAFVLLIASAFR